MSYAIYGLRLRGDTELRYIGLTGYTPESRLLSLTRQATHRGVYRIIGLCGWLNRHREAIEPVELCRIATKAEAHAAERAMVELFVRLNHRLFNTWLVPAEARKAAA